MFVHNILLAGCVTALALAGAARADEARVVGVRAMFNGDGSYDFDVTLRHPDTGWDHYVDRWDVLGPDGKVLGSRVLYHPHVNEQPFTRSQRISVPAGIRSVSIRTHCKIDGDGKTLFKVELPE
ncbi:MAG: hypothetical protein VW338_04915 [Rhodospirillaceae bacterium]